MRGKYQSVMNSGNFGDPNESYDETSMTAPSVRLNNRINAGSRLSDGMSEEYDYDSKKKGF